MTGADLRPAFVSCSAQDDNLGDLVIRRTALRWIEDASMQPHVLLSGVSETFVDGLGLSSNAVIYHEPWLWVRAAVAHAWRRPTALVYTPGPQSLAISSVNVGHAVVNAAMAAVVTRRGGDVVKLGRAIESGSAIMLDLERFLARRCSIYTVRDEGSRALLDDDRVRVEPDLAWAASLVHELDRGPTVARTRLSMSFRTDRSFDRGAIARLVDEARDRDLTPTFVTQVRRDDEQHQTLAADLGCEVVDWPAARSHRAQLTAVLRAYQQSAMVVSNRLHSVIFSMVAGAVPVGLAAPTDTKIARTLDVVGLADHVVSNVPVPNWLWEAEGFLPQLQQASARLARVQSDFDALVAPTRPDAATRGAGSGNLS